MKYGILPLLQNPSGKATDIAAGAGIGIVSMGLLNLLLGKLSEGATPTLKPETAATLKQWSPLLGGLLGGYAAYYAQPKAKARAEGHLVGAAVTGLALTAREMLGNQARKTEMAGGFLQKAFAAPSVSDYPALSAMALNGLVRDPRALQLSGLVNDPSVLRKAQMSRLQGIASGFSRFDNGGDDF